MYLAPEPVKELEDWFANVLRASIPSSVYIIITFKEDEEIEAVPYDYIKIIYTGVSTNVLINFTEQYFNFKVVYSCHLPATLLPHRRCLALAEKGRLALWEKTPPRPAQAYPLLLRSERLAKAKDCNCGPVYVQEWQAYNRIQGILVPTGDPCEGAGEPNALLPTPIDYITPLPNAPDKDYLVTNTKYDKDSPITNGSNQPYDYNSANGTWVINPGYDPTKPTEWGNLPFIIQSFIKALNINVMDKVTDTTLWTQ